jgi:uncharacterized membrane protein
MSTTTSSRSLKDYSSAPFEILLAVLTFAPIGILFYFYPSLPDRIPVFLSLRGEVEVWAAKTIGSVFRVPAMAIDLQLTCFLMKYGTVKSQRVGTTEADAKTMNFQTHVVGLTTRLWDWLRCLVAFKMAAASLEVVFMNIDSLRFLWTPAWLLTWMAALLSIVAAIIYSYRLWQTKRTMKRAGIQWKAHRAESANATSDSASTTALRTNLIGGFLYFNPHDPAMFVEKYLLNFGNKWSYAFIASLIAYPILVFGLA